jgi:hypothetical protein
MQSVPITTKVVSSNPAPGEMHSMQHYVIKFVSDVRWISPGTPVSSSNKDDRHDITEILAATLACMVLYGQHDDVNGNRFTREVGSLYITVHRTVWGACVAWVIFACANGYGGRYDKNTESKSILQTIIIFACACVPNVARVCGLSILNCPLEFPFTFIYTH